MNSKNTFQLKAKIKNVIWQNPENPKVKIVNLFVFENSELENNFEQIAAKDYKGLLKEDVEYNLVAYFTDKSNTTIFIDAASIIVPSDNDNKLIDFFSSSLFPGIGKNSASSIVKKLNVNSVEKFLKNFDDVKNLIGLKKANTIKKIIENNYFDYELYQLFTVNSLPNSLLNKYAFHFGKMNLLEKIKQNPYGIVFLEPSINIENIKKICMLLDIEIDKKIFWKTLIFKQLENFTNETGSTYLNIDIFYKIFKKNNPSLKIKKTLFADLINQLKREKHIHVFKKNNDFFLLSEKNKQKENYIFNFLESLKTKKIEKIINAEKIINSEILDDEQKEAIIYSLNNPTCIITGIPGSGKSTIIHEIYEELIKVYKKSEVFILTPTGKATVVLKTKNKNVKTIHSFLKWDKENNTFDLNKLNPSDAKVVIIDEFSMVDIGVFSSLLEAIENIDKLILVGDFNQLPSVREGQILKDFIENDFLKTFILKNNYRQKNKRGILENALSIRNGDLPKFNSSSTIFLESNDKKYLNFLISFLKYFVANNSTKTYFEVLNILNILSVKYEGAGGINETNNFVQDFFHTFYFENKKPFYHEKKYKFYLWDKVIQIENDIDRDVFNGEIGFICQVNYNDQKEIKEIIVDYNKKMVSYSLANFLQNVKLAYAISVHKFQGSESDYIIFLIFTNQKRLLSKKLVYTAFSRAKSSLIVIGQYEAFDIAVSKENNKNRNTYLKFLLEK